MNTIPPNDFSYYEMLDEVVQQEPAGSLDPELMGSIAAIGIVKGQPFAPDARMKRILIEAVAVANATARSLFMSPRDPRWYYYPGSAWMPLTLTISGYDFETPPPVIEGPVQDGVRTPEGVKTLPPTGYRMLDARTNFYYGVMLVSPAEGHAPERNRLAVSHGHRGCEQRVLRRRQDVQGNAAEGHSRG